MEAFGPSPAQTYSTVRTHALDYTNYTEVDSRGAWDHTADHLQKYKTSFFRLTPGNTFIHLFISLFIFWVKFLHGRVTESTGCFKKSLIMR